MIGRRYANCFRRASTRSGRSAGSSASRAERSIGRWKRTAAEVPAACGHHQLSAHPRRKSPFVPRIAGATGLLDPNGDTRRMRGAAARGLLQVLPAFRDRFHTRDQAVPHAVGVQSGGRAGVVVVRQGEARRVVVTVESPGQCVPAIRQIRLPTERTVVSIHESSTRFELEDHARIRVGFAFPGAAPNDRAADSSTRLDISAEHELFDRVGVGEYVPYPFPWCRNCDAGCCHVVVGHRLLLIGLGWTRHPTRPFTAPLRR